MRVVVVYDSTGTIRTLMTSPEGGPVPSMRLDLGEVSGTIEVPDLSSELSPEAMHARLSEIAQHNVVEIREETRSLLTLRSSGQPPA